MKKPSNTKASLDKSLNETIAKQPVKQKQGISPEG